MTSLVKIIKALRAFVSNFISSEKPGKRKSGHQITLIQKEEAITYCPDGLPAGHLLYP